MGDGKKKTKLKKKKFVFVFSLISLGSMFYKERKRYLMVEVLQEIGAQYILSVPKVGPDFLRMPNLKIAFFSLFTSCFETAITFDRLELRKNRK